MHRSARRALALSGLSVGRGEERQREQCRWNFHTRVLAVLGAQGLVFSSVGLGTGGRGEARHAVLKAMWAQA